MERGSNLRNYLLTVRRRWPFLVASVAVGLAVALAVSYTTTPLYRTSAQLTFVKQPDIASAMSGNSSYVSSLDVKLEIETYAGLMSTGEMQAKAQAELDDLDLAVTPFTVTAEYVPDTSVMRITAESEDPETAQRIANAYAAAFTLWRKETTVARYKQAQKLVEEKLKGFTPEQVAASDPGYVSLAGRLQDLRVLEASATGNFLIASLAPLPTEPFTPRHVRDALLGLLIGIVAGIGLVALVEQLDVRVHTVDDIAALLGLPVLARLPRVPKEAGTDALAVQADSSGPTAEAFRMLRGNLEFVNVDGNVGSIIVSSCSQGEGKTTTAANLGLTLALAGKRVVVADCDLRRPRVHKYFGLSNRTGVSTVVSGRSTLREALHTVDVGSLGTGARDGGETGSLSVLTSGPLPPNPGEIVTSRRLAELLDELTLEVDLVVLDTPPFLVVGDAAGLARHADGLLVVSRLGTVTRAMLKEATEALAPLPCRKLGVVVTGIPVEGTAYRYRYYRDAGATEPEAELEQETPLTV